ncbi:MAG TPA: hypothetical protein DDY93_02420 [Dehalococcoidia bacterium]|jgi:ribosomal protein S27AE|nr:hypothetical protein [Dehalococcoidia bacterium]HBJ30204.1 hypothetical protein [Dehalococcoidia bacterium]
MLRVREFIYRFTYYVQRKLGEAGTTIWFKACPRCKQGLIMFAKDIYDEHIQCLQCGYMKDVNDESEALSIITGASHSDGTLSEATQPPRPTRMVG